MTRGMTALSTFATLLGDVERALGTTLSYLILALLYLGPFVLAFLVAYYRPVAPTDVYLAAAIAAIPFVVAAHRDW